MCMTVVIWSEAYITCFIFLLKNGKLDIITKRCLQKVLFKLHTHIISFYRLILLRHDFIEAYELIRPLSPFITLELSSISG